MLELVLIDRLLEVKFGLLGRTIDPEPNSQRAAEREPDCVGGGLATTQHAGNLRPQTVVGEDRGDLLSVRFPCLGTAKAAYQLLDVSESLISRMELFDHIDTAENQIVSDPSG
ncbi:hypothetical protein MYSI104531_26360 [Mycobacterium simiae]